MIVSPHQVTNPYLSNSLSKSLTLTLAISARSHFSGHMTGPLGGLYPAVPLKSEEFELEEFLRHEPYNLTLTLTLTLIGGIP